MVPEQRIPCVSSVSLARPTLACLMATTACSCTTSQQITVVMYIRSSSCVITVHHCWWSWWWRLRQQIIINKNYSSSWSAAAATSTTTTTTTTTTTCFSVLIHNDLGELVQDTVITNPPFTCHHCQQGYTHSPSAASASSTIQCRLHKSSSPIPSMLPSACLRIHILHFITHTSFTQSFSENTPLPAFSTYCTTVQWLHQHSQPPPQLHTTQLHFQLHAHPSNNSQLCMM